MTVPVNNRREKSKQLKAFHQNTLDTIGVPNATVIPKMAFKATGLTEKVIGLFQSEVSKREDLYIEFTDRDLNPEVVDNYPPRALLKWRFNPQYDTEYARSNEDATAGDVRFYIPISELIIVSKTEEKTNDLPKLRTTNNIIIQEERESSVDELAMVPPDKVDVPFSEMTLRDYAAIHLNKPLSNKKWLNDLILK